MIYSLEDAHTLVNEILPLMQEVWNEVDQRKDCMELDIDIQAYKDLYDAGLYKPYTIRTEDNELVGYIGIFIQPSLHCKGKRTATTDVMFVKPDFRGQGAKLLFLIEKDLPEYGVNWFCYTTKAWLDDGHLAEKLGYKLYEKNYQKRL